MTYVYSKVSNWDDEASVLISDELDVDLESDGTITLYSYGNKKSIYFSMTLDEAERVAREIIDLLATNAMSERMATDEEIEASFDANR